MSRYYFYRLYKSLPAIAVTLITGFLFVNIGLISNYGSYFSNKNHFYVTMESILVFFCIEAFAFAYLEFSSFRNKRNLDTWFSFPLSREKIAIVHMLNVLTIYCVQMAIFTANGVLLILACDGVNMLYFFPAMLSCGIFGFLLFCFASCTFLFGNSVFDGVVSIFAWVNIPSSISTAITYIRAVATQRYEVFFEDNINLSAFRGITALNQYLEYMMNRSVYKKIARDFDMNYFYMNDYKHVNTEDWVSLAIWLVLFVVAAVAVPYVFSKRPSEKIGGISDFILCYDLIIPFYLVFLFIVAGDIIQLKLFFVIAAYIAYAIYRKSPNITIKRFVIIGVFLVLAFIPFYDLLGVDTARGLL